MKTRRPIATVGRVTPCAPQRHSHKRNGAQGLTRPTIKDRRPPVTQREANELAQWGIFLRSGIERDTLLMPWLIADSVLAEASQFLNVDLPDEWAAYLDQRAERCYLKH